MKKILSILSILSIFSSSTLLANGGIACNSNSDKILNLKSFKFFNVGVSLSNPRPEPPAPTPPAKLVVSYTSVENIIMKQYNSFENKNELKLDNFVIGDASKLSEDKTFAIQLIDPKTNKALPSDVLTTDGTLNKPTGNNVLKNNALKVSINTNDKNVPIKQATLPVYLDNFVFTNANLNNGNDIVTSNPSQGTTLLSQNNAIDVTNIPGVYLMLSSRTQASEIIEELSNNPTALRISKPIVDNLNTQLQNETSLLNNLNILKTVSDSTNVLEQKQRGNIFLYAKNNTGINSIPSYNNLPANSKIFARVKVFISNYIAFPNTYCYLYLGTTTS